MANWAVERHFLLSCGINSKRLNEVQAPKWFNNQILLSLSIILSVPDGFNLVLKFKLGFSIFI